ncbi:hypothetical protein Dimus_003380 [Dionaea muscipula]
MHFSKDRFVMPDKIVFLYLFIQIFVEWESFHSWPNYVDLCMLCSSLNSNGFSGTIPSSIGNLTKLYWLDLTDNEITGSFPVSNATTHGLDLLVNTKHLYGQL